MNRNIPVTRNVLKYYDGKLYISNEGNRIYKILIKTILGAK